MWNWFKKILGFEPKKPAKLPEFTLGEPNEMNVCKVYADGVETQMTMLVFREEEVKKLQEIQEKIYKNEWDINRRIN